MVAVVELGRRLADMAARQPDRRDSEPAAPAVSGVADENCPAIGLHFLGSTAAVWLVSVSSFDAFQSEIEPPTEELHLDAIAVFTLSERLEPFPAQ